MKNGLGIVGAFGVAICLAAQAFMGGAQAQDKSKVADCRIESANKVQFDGKCRLTPEGDGGSFSLSRSSGEGSLYGSIVTVSVYLLGPTVAEVRGLTLQGINSRWGQARRSAKDRTCWAGADFKVCAR